MSVTKFFSRFQVVIASAAFRLFSSFSNLIVSLFIVRLYSAELWGEIVYYLLFLDLGFVVVNWGHSFYLSRQFSLNPQFISGNFQKALVSRAYILMLFVIVVVLLPVEIEIRLVLIAFSIFRFLYQAFDPIVQYHRNFLLALCIEFAGVLLIIVPLLMFSSVISLLTALSLFAISFTIRALFTTIIFRRFLSGFTFNTRIRDFLKPSVPFLFLTLTAMLQQRMDLYIVARYHHSSDVGAYQVFVSLLLLSHVAASLLLSPYARNMFRMSHKRLKRLERQFMAIGIVLSGLSMGVIFLILEFAFQIYLTSEMYILGYFYVLLYYFYQVRSYQFMKENRQMQVAVFSLVGCLVSLIVSLRLIPRFAVEGAMIAGLSTQLVNAILHLSVRFNDSTKQPEQSSSTAA